MARKIKPVFQVFHPLIFKCVDKELPLRIEDFRHIVPKIHEAEFGFGKGSFILRQAAENPDKIYVAVEAVPGLFFKALEKACAKELPNLYLVLGDARLFFSLYLADAKLETIYFLFPDPWRKSRYHKHRMVSEKTVPYLVKLLKDDGRLVARSDNHIVIFDIYEKFLENGLRLRKLEWNENVENAYTDWEKKAIFDERKILHSEFVLPSNSELPELEPLFDIRQVSYRTLENEKINVVNNAPNTDTAKFNALSIPDSLLF